MGYWSLHVWFKRPFYPLLLHSVPAALGLGGVALGECLGGQHLQVSWVVLVPAVAGGCWAQWPSCCFQQHISDFSE